MYDEQQTVFIKKACQVQPQTFDGMYCIQWTPLHDQDPEQSMVLIELKYTSQTVSYTNKVEVRMRKKLLSDGER